ncbi:DUF3027 domain-containing protein [Actinobaculum suis]|nr:DUF3027 domain-containing protein [Actinobaculum suis]
MADLKLEAVAQAAVITPEQPDRVYPQADCEGERLLVRASETAQEFLKNEIPERYVGAHAGLILEEERVLTHYFKCEHPGYQGWYWAVTIARAPRSRRVTISEYEMVPGEKAMLAPRWVPWADRMEAIEAEKRNQEEAAAEYERREREARRERRAQQARAAEAGQVDGTEPAKEKTRRRECISRTDSARTESERTESGTPRTESGRTESARAESGRTDSTRQGSSRKDIARKVSAREESTRKGSAREESRGRKTRGTKTSEAGAAGTDSPRATRAAHPELFPSLASSRRRVVRRGSRGRRYLAGQESED